MRFPLRGNGVIKKSICSGLMRTYVLMSLTGRCRIITIQHSIPASRREPLWGSPIPHWVGRAGHGQNAGQRSPKGRTKRLTFTEGRLRLTTFDYVECKAFDFEEVTTRPESQAFRLAVRWADGFLFIDRAPYKAECKGNPHPFQDLQYARYRLVPDERHIS